MYVVPDDENRQWLNMDGDSLVSTTPYSEQENMWADQRDVERQEESNRQTIEQALANSLVALQEIIDDTNSNINSNPAQRIKVLARAQRRTIRLLVRRFEDTQ